MKVLEKFNQFSKSKKIIICALACILVADIILASILLGTRKNSNVTLDCINETKQSTLVAMDSYSRKGVIKETGFANFKFTDEQKSLFKKVYGEKGSVAVTVRIKIKPTTKQSLLIGTAVDLPFQFGFLSTDDFEKNGKIKIQNAALSKRILISANLQDAPDVFDVSFALQKNEDITKYIPEGFFIYSTLQTQIQAVCIGPAQLGFDFSEIPYFGFGPNGGKIDFINKSFDFAGAALVFPVQNTVTSVMPELYIQLEEDPAFKSTLYDSVSSEVNIGGEKLSVKNVVQSNKLVISTGALRTPFSRLDVSKNSECIKSIIMKGVTLGKYDGIEIDPGLILKYKPSNWRNQDYEVFKWDRFPNVLFFDTKDFAVQERMFSRIAFFIEKEGYKGRILSNEELEGKHGYNAHDYSAESFAKFFNKVTQLNFKLNVEEEQVKKILIQNGLISIAEDGVTVIPNEGGIVSISQESPDWSRINLLAHEGWHTIFFMDEEFRNFVSAVYYTMDQKSLAFIIDYFKSQPHLGYDTNDEYLMHNEMMAYIMENQYSKVCENFVKKAQMDSVMRYTPDIARYIINTNASGLEDAATALNDFVFDKYGIVCGNIALINR